MRVYECPCDTLTHTHTHAYLNSLLEEGSVDTKCLILAPLPTHIQPVRDFDRLEVRLHLAERLAYVCVYVVWYYTM
jgi:hypothetical protein